jgi:endogenous inhibitor of DNA gyrase (YacG/DUF329 family)
MPKIMITCPETRKPVFTGMDLPKNVFEKAQIQGNSVSCPHCGQVHAWSRDDAYLANQ